MLLYLHIPFCDSKCHYCAFNSYVELFAYKKSYIEALKKQLVHELKLHNPVIQTVFIGGGTPSTIEAKEYEEILKIITPYFEHEKIEITIEANPNSVNDVWLKKIFKSGINRISFGVQSFNDEKLKFLGRNHSKTQAIKAIEQASKAGFVHINMDIIYDTSHDTKNLLLEDLNIISSLPIDHVSAYSLTIEEGTRFFDKNNVQVEDVALAKMLFHELERRGFLQYEISNFSKNKEARSKHNLGYWNYTPYLGIGAGAVGYVNNQRYYPPKDILKYIQNPLEYESIENLSDSDKRLEKLFLGLRSQIGVDMQILSKIGLEKLKELESLGRVEIQNGRIYNRDFLLADELALFLDY